MVLRLVEVAVYRSANLVLNSPACARGLCLATDRCVDPVAISCKRIAKMLNDTLHVVPVEEYAFPGIRILLDPISKDEISVAFPSSYTITLDVHSDEVAFRPTKYVGTDRCKLLIVKTTRPVQISLCCQNLRSTEQFSHYIAMASLKRPYNDRGFDNKRLFIREKSSVPKGDSY